MIKYTLKFKPNSSAISCEKTNAYCKYLNLELKDRFCVFARDKEDLEKSKSIANMLLSESPKLMQANISLVVLKWE